MWEEPVHYGQCDPWAGGLSWYKKGSYALAWEEARKQHCSIVPASILASKFPPQDPAPTSLNAL